MTSSVQELLKTPVSHIVAEQKLVFIDSKAPVPKALNILVKNNIYSAPVYDEQKKEWKGFIDLCDIVTYIVHIIDAQKEQNKGQPYQYTDADFYTLLEQVQRFDLTYADRVVDLSKHNPMIPIQKDATIADALKIFATKGVHRLPIMDNDKLIKVLTASAVVNWLASVDLDRFGKRSIKDLNLGVKEVFTVTTQTRAIDAFRLMSQQRISAVGIVDDHGRLLTNLSVKDIKLVAREALFTKLYLPVIEFIRSEKYQAYVGVMKVSQEDTVTDVLKKFVAWKVHRVYLADADGHPVGVIALQDLLSALFNELTTSETVP